MRVRKLYEELMGREFWSAEQWRECQDSLLRSFVRHCYENVPFYRDRFDSVNLKPGEIGSVEDIEKIPVLKKEEVRANTERLLATNFSKSKLKEGHTTGSTGAPLTFYGSRQRGEYTVAGLWRIYSRCGWEPGEGVASIWGFSDAAVKMPGPKKWLRDIASGTTHLNAWEANEEEFAQWCKILRKRKPGVLICYASSGSRFAKWLLDHDERLPDFKGVYCTSEKLYAAQRDQLAEAFQCPVFDMYGCGEAIHIACTCERQNMHTSPDMCVVETGQADETGRKPLIITGLRNWAMPFLRYMNGDCGELKEGFCECGRKSPLMQLDFTRVADVFTFADGKKYPSLYFVLRLYKEGFDGVGLFQFHQDTIDHIYLRIAKNPDFTDQTANNLKAAVEEIEEHIKHQAKVEILYVDNIDQSANAKHYYAKSDVDRR